MSHDLTNHNKSIANNLSAQQYTTRLMLRICNIKDMTFVLLKPKNFYNVLFGKWWVRLAIFILLGFMRPFVIFLGWNGPSIYILDINFKLYIYIWWGPCGLVSSCVGLF